MGPVLPAAPRRKSRSEQFGRAISAGLGTYFKAHNKKEEREKEDKQLEEMGINARNLTPEVRKVVIESSVKNMGKQLQRSEEKEERRIEDESLLEQGVDVRGLGKEARAAKLKEHYKNEYKKEDAQKEKKLIKKTAGEGFDSSNPKSWSDNQIENFRAIEPTTPKAKSLVNKAENEFKRRSEATKAEGKYQEKAAPLQGALETISQMEKIGQNNNLGIGTSIRGLVSPQARRDAAEYERLGKSLISFASNIPIRNRQEFETLADDLYDPSISDAKREGILKAMKKIVENSMKSYSAPEKNEQSPAKNERPPLTSFFR